MISTVITLKEMTLFPELFLGISIIYIFIYGTFISYSTNQYPLIQSQVCHLGILTLVLVFILLISDNLLFFEEQSTFNDSISSDFLSFCSKLFILFFSSVSLLIIKQNLIDQKINNFEYIIILLLSILGMLILCSANDLVTAYLAIELQTLAFYTLAAFKKNSAFSAEAGLKYFVLGSLASGFFLFGSSFLYGITGSTNFEDFKDLFFWVVPGSIAYMNFEKFLATLNKEIYLQIFSDLGCSNEGFANLLNNQDLAIVLQQIQHEIYSNETKAYYAILNEALITELNSVNNIPAISDNYSLKFTDHNETPSISIIECQQNILKLFVLLDIIKFEKELQLTHLHNLAMYSDNDIRDMFCR